MKKNLYKKLRSGLALAYPDVNINVVLFSCVTELRDLDVRTQLRHLYAAPRSNLNSWENKHEKKSRRKFERKKSTEDKKVKYFRKGQRPKRVCRK
jgi:hypothetical protein